ncbi:HupE/UreJ family protein [Sulfuriflexus sp.]|uniref:HupE/UreJ family protein n=1 Tax=Sulfuriflexus sp. TaxID=2015443 RepID=UPI0028CC1DA4|nr:HupE/UreJ family protein [Sulfuriflexus sp.]MDT8405106.1 HupE/UreJ family protein [Sulfuriflexus sp.]
MFILDVHIKPENKIILTARIIAMNLVNNIPNNSLRKVLALTMGTLLFSASPAYAHHLMDGATPQTFAQGFLSGLAHPIIGLDHLAFLVVAILLACSLKGSMRYLTPLAFVAATVGGAVLHLGAVNIPMSETLVALTVIMASMLVLTRKYPGAFVLSIVFAVSGIFHGYAYGESIVGAETTPLLAYLIGYAGIQYTLIIGGVIGMEKLTAHSEHARNIAVRFSSAVAFLTGGLFVALSFA